MHTACRGVDHMLLHVWEWLRVFYKHSEVAWMIVSKLQDTYSWREKRFILEDGGQLNGFVTQKSGGGKSKGSPLHFSENSGDTKNVCYSGKSVIKGSVIAEVHCSLLCSAIRPF